MWKKYGVVFIGTYFSMYASTLGLCYGAIEYGLADTVDVTAATNKYVC